MLGKTVRKAAVCALLTTSGLSLATMPVWAQEGGNRSKFTFSLVGKGGSNLDLEPGVDDTEYSLTSVLGYEFIMARQATQLSFSTSIRPEVGSEESTGAYPNLNFKFAHQAPRHTVGMTLRYQEAKISDQSISYDDTGTIVTYDSSGTRELSTVGLEFVGGVDMPFGYTLGLTHNRVDYSDIDNTSSYYATQTDGASLSLRADVSAMTSVRLNTRYTDYEADNAVQTHRVSQSAGVSVSQRLNAVTMLGASLGYSRVEVDRIGSPTEVTEGGTYGLSLDRDDPLGTYSVAWNRSITENGARDSLTFSRNRETQMGKLSGMIGVSRNDVSDKVDWLGKFSYTFELPRDTLSAAFSRSVATSDDGEDVVISRFSGNLAHKLTPVSALDFGLTASSAERDAYDTLRLDASMAYQHELAQDVSLAVGVNLAVSQDDRYDDATSQSVFLRLTKSLEFLH